VETIELAHTLVDTILDKQGHNIALLDLREQSIFADYFLICNGENSRQLRALARSINEDAKEKASVRPVETEGSAESGWLLVDFGDLVVHLFDEHTREFYDLEGLWQDAYVVLRMQ